MLYIGKSNEVKFKLNIFGTQSKPDVRIIIETEDSDLGFKAEEVRDEPGRYYAEISIDEALSPGTYKFRVEVIINDRLIVPLRRTVEIQYEEPLMAAPEVTPPVEEPIAPELDAVRSEEVVPKTTKPEVSKISIIDIAKEAEKVQVVVRENISKPKIKITPRIPIKLTKGEVVYK
jgi:hypothetical protein